MANKTNSLKARVEALEKNAAIVVSLDEYRYTTIKSNASVFGVELNRRYSTKLNRENRTCTITRHE